MHLTSPSPKACYARSPEAEALWDTPELRDHKQEQNFLEFPLLHLRQLLLPVCVPPGLTFKKTYLSQSAVESTRGK